MSKNELLEILANEVDSMNISPLEKQLEAYTKGLLTVQEVDNLYAMAELDAELKTQLAVYKPVNAQIRQDIENEIVSRFFNGADKINTTDENCMLSSQTPQKTDTHLGINFSNVIKYLKKHFILLTASPVLAVFSSLFIFNLLHTDELVMTDYSMEIFGSNQQYRYSSPAFEQKFTNEKLPEFFPENQMVIILRPYQGISEELEVLLFIEHDGKLTRLDADKERSEYGSFKITPNPSSLPRFLVRTPTTLVAIISKPNSVPDLELISKNISENSNNNSRDWVILQKTVILSPDMQ